MASPTIARLSQSRPYICRQCVSQTSKLRRQFSVSRALQQHLKDESNGNVLELLEARGYIKEIAGSAIQFHTLHPVGTIQLTLTQRPQCPQQSPPNKTSRRLRRHRSHRALPPPRPPAPYNGSLLALQPWSPRGLPCRRRNSPRRRPQRPPHLSRTDTDVSARSKLPGAVQRSREGVEERCHIWRTPRLRG
jgi:hypothetical protein